MITTKDKLACVERELTFRRRVYARLEVRGKMTPVQRAREIELMEAIAEDYRALVADEQGELQLFIETRDTVNERR
jgi:hypothetical protein